MATTNDEYKLPVTRPQGGKLDDDTSRPDGVGVPSSDQPNLPSRQPVQTPTSFTRRKK
jgi:hypothetical protein